MTAFPFEFDFGRSHVLASARPDGNEVVISTGGPGIRLPRTNVLCRVVEERFDTSVRLVDLGGLSPSTHAIIHVGHEDQLPF